MIVSRTLVMSLCIGGILATSGCGSPRPDAHFTDVQKLSSERLGRQIHWNLGGPEDQEVAEKIQKLLSKDLTAENAVQVALLNNRRLQAVYEDIGIAQADLVGAGLLRNPVFSAAARFQRGGGVNIELSLVGDFLDVFFIPMRKRLAATAFDAAKLRVADAILDLAGETQRAFYRLQTSVQLLEMRRIILQSTTASYDLAKRIRAAGNSTDLDLAHERSLHEQSKLELSAAETQVSDEREVLNMLMGTWGKDTGWAVSSRLADIPADDPQLDAIEQKAIEANLQLGVAKQSVVLRSQQLGISRPFAIFEPIEAGVSAERDPNGTWGVGPAVSLPIPLFNNGQPAVASAQAELRRSQALYYAEAVELRARVRVVRNRLVAARQRANYFFHVVLPLRAVIVERTQEQYNGMLASPFQLILVKQQQIDAGAQYVVALGMYWNARSSLDQLMMGGTPPAEPVMEMSSSLEQPTSQSTPGERR